MNMSDGFINEQSQTSSKVYTPVIDSQQSLRGGIDAY